MDNVNNQPGETNVISNNIETLIWTVVFRDSTDSPQQELKRYTEQAADRFALDVITNGGVAIVIEGSEPDGPDMAVFNIRDKGELEWPE